MTTVTCVPQWQRIPSSLSRSMAANMRFTAASASATCASFSLAAP